MITIALADDHILLRNALANLINGFSDCRVAFEASNGIDLEQKINGNRPPEIAILDLNMPERNGYDTVAWFREKHPDVKLLMLTMYDGEEVLIRLLKMGVRGFLKKDIHPEELKEAIRMVAETGYYYSHHISAKMAKLFRQTDEELALTRTNFNKAELEFLHLICTDKTYKEIAFELGLNPRSIDNLREALFQKVGVKSRVGLAIYVLQTGLIIL